jgi:hypothetical protein
MFKRIPVQGEMDIFGHVIFHSKCVYLVDDGILYAHFKIDGYKWFVKKPGECWKSTSYKTLAEIKQAYTW